MDIKIGLTVVEANGGYGFNGYSFTEIVRETKTQWVCKNGTRYRKDTLRVVGDAYGSLTIATNKHKELNKKYNLKSKIKTSLYDLSMIRNSFELDDYEKLVETKVLLDKLKELIK